MNTHQTDDVIAGYRKGMDAQQQIIADLRDENRLLKLEVIGHSGHIEELTGKMRNMVRLDGPVVTGLVEVLSGYAYGGGPECFAYDAAVKALSAYEARVKEVGK